MRKKFVFALDFGSSEIRLLAGFKGEFLKVVVAYKFCEKYEGFVDGTFLEPEKLFDVLQKLIKSAEIKLGVPVKEIAVGVPSEFVSVKTKKVNVTFVDPKKLSNEFLANIYLKMIDDVENYLNVSADVVYHQLDDENFYKNVKNMKATKVSSLLCLSYIKRDFIDLINNLLKNIDVARVEYKVSAVCECQKTFHQTKENDFVFVDVGYLTTTVAEVKNGLPTNLMSFSLGGAHIMQDFFEALELDCDNAEKLKQKLVLTLKSTSTDFYEIAGKHISTKLVNTIASERIKMIAFYIKECFKNFETKTFQVYLTGGGISCIKGVKDILKQELCCDVEIIKPDNIEFATANEFSEIALIENLII